MSTSLTDRAVQAAKLPPGKAEHYISDRDGLYLRLRSGKNGVSKAWVLRYQHHGVARKMSLGSYPEMSLAEAREDAQRAARQRQVGDDPLAVRAADEARARAEAIAVRLSAAPVTVADLLDQWLTNVAARNHKDGGRYARTQLTNHVLPLLGTVHLAHLRVRDIAALLDRIHTTGKQRTCGVVLSLLRQAAQWGVAREYLQGDVTTTLRPGSWGGKGQVRERHLSDDELRQLYHALTYSTILRRWQHAIWLMLACGTRVGETLLTERSHVDLARRTWTIPAANQKRVRGRRNNLTRDIQLSDFALQHMQQLLALGGDRYLFPQRSGVIERPANEKTLTHLVDDRQTDTPKPGRTQHAGELRLPGGHWTPHDLRRTCATGMGELGVRPDVIDRCLGHAVGDRITQTYQRQQLREHMHEAWDSWGQRLSEIVHEAACDTATAKAAVEALEARQAAKRAVQVAKTKATKAARKAKAEREARQAATSGRQRAAQVQA